MNVLAFCRSLFGAPAFLCLLLLASRPAKAANPGTVHLVVGSDTALWDGLDIGRYHCHYAFGLFTNVAGNAYRVMDPAFRSRFTDSYGQTLKLTWWMMVGNIFRYADNTDVPVPNLMTLHLMKTWHGAALRQFGDELGLHYHTFLWSDFSGNGRYYWNEAPRFADCRDDFDFSLAQFFLEEEVFPVSFRSGWHYMDDQWQQYLDNFLPFSLDDNSPYALTDSVPPIENVYDWSQAPTAFVPFHPSSTNYQTPGQLKGWNVRSVKMPNMTQSLMDSIFKQAAGGADQVACLWAHLPEIDFTTNVARIDSLAHAAAANYPAVRFRYCTAVEAMQRWMGVTNKTPPALTANLYPAGNGVTLLLQSSAAIFQPQPVVVAKDVLGNYQFVSCQLTNTNAWVASVPILRTNLLKIGVAVTDPAGHLATQFFSFTNQQALFARVTRDQLTFSWAAPCVLQSSTNAAGPYFSVPTALSPFSVSLTSAPQQFFRAWLWTGEH